ncbi:MAG: type I restriction enzyme HsdR N-terminal domain-containing protein [Bacteroidetes bacterium]|nr:type I restriction enzyme HsdR N-terminal domain-containing protein [Bacteroidota bacterium]
MQFPQLNLPTFDFKIRLDNESDKLQIFDIIRKKYVVITPEEWVRQNFVHFLVLHKNYPASLLKVERLLKVHKVTKRTDILIHDTKGKPLLLVECKAPDIAINNVVFEQALVYNIELKVPFLIATNGITHTTCKLDIATNSHTFLNEIPDYTSINNLL